MVVVPEDGVQLEILGRAYLNPRSDGLRNLGEILGRSRVKVALQLRSLYRWSRHSGHPDSSRGH